MIHPMSKSTLVTAALMSLGLGAAPMVTNLAQAQQVESYRPPSAPPLLAQIESCRQVSSTVSGLNVRQAPSLGAGVVGVVPGGNEVVLQDLGTGGWAPITAPYNGYVSTSYLTNCAPGVGGTFNDAPVAADPASATNMCRQVIVRSGLNVRAEPTVYSTRLTALSTGTNVQVAGPATNNWVPIAEPVDGYVSSRFLGACY